MKNFNILSTNSRSITPKIDSFIEYLKELETSIAFLTETWLTDSPELEQDLEELEIATGYRIIHKNRPSNNRGYSTGGVALAYRKSDLSLKPISLPGNDFEILFSVGTLPRFTRVLIAICVYLPPGMSGSSVRSALEYLVDAILEFKNRYNDPVSYTHLTLPTIYSV